MQRILKHKFCKYGIKLRIIIFLIVKKSNVKKSNVNIFHINFKAEMEHFRIFLEFYF